MILLQKTIYKKDQNNNIRYILIVAKDSGELWQESGIVGTDKPILHTKMCKGKNIGKSNETTPGDQAVKELESFVKEKCKKEYFPTIKEAEEESIVLPMLAYSYKDYIKKIDWTSAYVQPKLDGMRALGNKELISRENNVINTLPHLTKAINLIDLHLDGEAYGHGLSFQENMELIKKYVPGKSENIKYHVYDIVSSKPFSERTKELAKAIKASGSKDIILVKTVKVKDEEELKIAHKLFISQGYEGTILRWGDAPYKINGRSANLLKYKDHIDIALPILDIVPCETEVEWGEPVFYWEGAKNSRHGKDRLGAGTKYSHAQKKDLLINKDKYVGKIAEVRFFEYSDTGVPRFPVMHGIRLDKAKGDK